MRQTEADNCASDDRDFCIYFTEKGLFVGSKRSKILRKLKEGSPDTLKVALALCMHHATYDPGFRLKCWEMGKEAFGDDFCCSEPPVKIPVEPVKPVMPEKPVKAVTNDAAMAKLVAEIAGANAMLQYVGAGMGTIGANSRSTRATMPDSHDVGY